MKTEAPVPADARQMHLLADLCPDLLCIMQPDGRLDYVNQAFLDTLGYDGSDIPSLSLLSLAHVDCRESMQTALEQARDGDGISTPAFRCRCRDGSFRQLEWLALDGDGSGRLYGVARDITVQQSGLERKASRHKGAMNQAEELRFVVENAIDAVYCTDKEANILYVNESACRVLGYSYEELTALSIFDIDWDYPRERWLLDWEQARKGRRETFETVHRRKDGSAVPVEINLRVMEFQGSEMAASFVRDISERKQVMEALYQSEARFRGLFEGSAVGMVVLSPDNRVVMCNPSFCRILGYTLEELTGRGSMSFTHPDDVGIQAELTRQLISGELGHYNIEKRYLTRDGRTVWGNTTVSIIRDETDNVQHFIAQVQDITGARQAARQTEELRFTIDNAVDSVFLYNKKGEIYYVNESACRRLGYGFDELTSMTIFDLDPDFSREVWPAGWEWGKRGELQIFETTHTRKDGSRFPVEITFRVTEFEGTEYAAAFARDISERKEVERHLLFLQYALDNAGDSVLMMNREGDILYANDTASRNEGYSKEELSAMKIHDLDPRLRTGELDWDQVWQGISDGAAHTFEVLHERSDGSTYPIEITTRMTEFAGEAFACSFERDISARKQAEQALKDSEAALQLALLRLTYLVENSPLAVIELDQAMQIRRWTSRAEAMFGWSADEMIGQTFTSSHIVFKDDIATAESRIEQVRNNELSSYVDQYRNCTKNGDVINCEWYVSTLRGNDNEILSVLALVHDITKQIRAQEKLQTYQEHLEELVSSRTEELEAAQEELIRKERLAVLGQLTGVVSHELRNPLASIRTSFYLVSKNLNGDPAMQQRALERIERNIERCDSIIDELLDYTHVRPLEFIPLDFDAWLAAAIAEYPIPDGIAVESRLVAGAQVAIEPERLRRCLINLFSNACEAMLGQPEDKPGCLRIETDVAAAGVEVIVEDNGPGIPDELLQKIFEPLFSTKGFGVGLGLAIVEQIVKQHHGTIQFSSRVGKGTRVSLWLPVS